MVVKMGVLKFGNIGASLVLEVLLDERADREDLEVRAVGSGAKITQDNVEEAQKRILDSNPDLILHIGPHSSIYCSEGVLKTYSEYRKPVILVSDLSSKKAMDDLEKRGIGYIILKGDPMIGARREFLDPTEMSVANSDILKVLSVTGAIRAVHKIIDGVVDDIKKGASPRLPRVFLSADAAVAEGGFRNPYAAAKARAAYEMNTLAAELTYQGCFKVDEREKYLPLIASAHELIRSAARLADESREIEKTQGTLLRTPHGRNGSILKKREFMDKPR